MAQCHPATQWQSSTRDAMAITDEQVSIICREVAGGKSMRQVCRDNGFDRSLVYDRLAVDQAFSDQYARACNVRSDDVFDEIFDIADDATNDWMRDSGDTGWIAHGEHVQRSRLRIDARKWALARMQPRKYGDRLAIGGSNDMDPIKTEDVAAEKLAALIDSIAERSGETGSTDD